MNRRMTVTVFAALGWVLATALLLSLLGTLQRSERATRVRYAVPAPVSTAPPTPTWVMGPDQYIPHLGVPPGLRGPHQYGAPLPTPAPGREVTQRSGVVLGLAAGSAHALVARAAREFNQPADWMDRVVWCESNYNEKVTNPYSGAQGIAQFMPATFYGWVYRLWWAPHTWLSPYNPRVATRLMAWAWAHGWASAWSCSYVVGYLGYGFGTHTLLPTHWWQQQRCHPPLATRPQTCFARLPDKGRMANTRHGHRVLLRPWRTPQTKTRGHPRPHALVHGRRS